MYQIFKNAITVRQMGALTREAKDRQTSSMRIEADSYRLVNDHVVSTAAFRFAETGPALGAVLDSGVLGGLLKDRFGVDLEPVTTAYNYYDVGDHIGIHRDAPSHQFAALIPLSPQIQPMHVYPELAPLDGRGMHERIQSGHLGVREHVTLPFLGVVVLRGSVVPRELPRAMNPGLVASVCFG